MEKQLNGVIKHIHPRNADAIIWGRKLRSGETLNLGDKHDGALDWEDCPCPGLPVLTFSNKYWVRPEPLQKLVRK